MSFPTLKLTYFDFAARAELTRLALYVGGIPFEDERLSREEFAARKPTLPFKQVPTLTVNGEVLAQSQAMARYAGRLGGLYPSDALAAYRVDEILASSEDLLLKLGPSLREPDNEKKLAMRKELSEGAFPEHLACVEARLKSTSDGKYFLGDKLTIADLEIYGIRKMFQSGWLDGIPASITDGYPRLNAIADAVAAHPKIQEWEANHKA